MKYITLCFTLCLLVVPAAWATEVNVGGTLVNIPAPAGYVATTSKMHKLSVYLQHATPSENKALVAFIPEQDVSKALDGSVPVATYFAVQTPKCCVNKIMTDSQFGKVKKIMKTQNSKMVHKVEKEFPTLIRSLESYDAKTYGNHIKFSNLRLIPLPVEYETKHAIAYSLIFKAKVQPSSSNSGPLSVGRIVTVTLVYVKGKPIYLYCFPGQKGLQWSQGTSKHWADAVISANR